jgi:putative phosphoribosyl transferase
LILVRKIGVPIQPELAMGAVVDGAAPIIVRNEEVIELADIDESTFKAIYDSELAEIERRVNAIWVTGNGLKSAATLQS